MKHVVIGLIFKNHKLCVAQRLSNPFMGYIECPGGKVEAHETLEEALKRELFEEIGLLNFDQIYMSYIDVNNEYGLFRLHFFKVIPHHELSAKVYTELLWVAKDKLKDLNWIPHNLPYIDFFIQADQL